MKRDELLEQVITEGELFLREFKAFQKHLNENRRTCGVDAYDYYDAACIELLKARSLLLIRKLQAWRKRGNVE